MDMEVRITIVDIVVLLLQQTEETIFEALQETCLPVILKRVKACYLRGFEHRGFVARGLYCTMEGIAQI